MLSEKGLKGLQIVFGSGHDVKLHRRQRLQFETAFLLQPG